MHWSSTPAQSLPLHAESRSYLFCGENITPMIPNSYEDR